MWIPPRQSHLEQAYRGLSKQKSSLQRLLAQAGLLLLFKPCTRGMHPVTIHAYTSPCSTSNVSRHMTVTPVHRTRHLWPLNQREPTRLAPCRQRPQPAAYAGASTHPTSPSGYISSAAAAGLEAEPLVGSDLTAAIDGLLAPLASRAWALLGATDKWQLYLLNRFLLEVVLPVAAVYAMLALVSRGVQVRRFGVLAVPGQLLAGPDFWGKYTRRGNVSSCCGRNRLRVAGKVD